MSKTIDRAPLAITSDGALLVNAAVFDVPKNIDALVELVKLERGAVFIGVVVSGRELDRLRDQLDDATLQAAFLVAGSRQAMRRSRSK